MVSLPDEPGTEQGPSVNWWTTGIFTIAAMLGLWWAQLQQQSIQESTSTTFQVPGVQWILWSLTLAAVGVCFGLAIAAGSSWRQRIAPPALLWGTLPLAVVVSFHLWLAGLTSFPANYLRLTLSPAVQAACAIAVGVFLSGLLAPTLPASRPEASAGGSSG